MYLTDYEEKMLDGEYGEWVSRAMKLIVKLGELAGAERLTPIRRAHLSGISYKTAGDAAIQLLEDMANDNVRVKTFTTLNPAGIDLLSWKEMGVPEEFVVKQKRLVDAYVRLGAKPALTCAPYFFENVPERNEIVAFAESSAIIFVNSVIGARTNRHGSLDALAAAIVGRVALTGLLLDENRRANILVKVHNEAFRENDFGLLGLHIGGVLKPTDVPAFVFQKNPSINELRLLGAALAASGALAMFHVIGVTPEAKNQSMAFGGETPEDVLIVDKRDIIATREKYFGEINEPDAAFIGCPHASLEEIRYIASLLKGRKIKEDVKFWIFTSRRVLNALKQETAYQIIIKAGGRIFADTCMVVAPIEFLGVKKILTNSSKAAWYIPRFSGGEIFVDVRSLDEIINIITIKSG